MTVFVARISRQSQHVGHRTEFIAANRVPGAGHRAHHTRHHYVLITARSIRVNTECNAATDLASSLVAVDVVDARHGHAPILVGVAVPCSRARGTAARLSCGLGPSAVSGELADVRARIPDADAIGVSAAITRTARTGLSGAEAVVADLPSSAVSGYSAGGTGGRSSTSTTTAARTGLSGGLSGGRCTSTVAAISRRSNRTAGQGGRVADLAGILVALGVIHAGGTAATACAAGVLRLRGLHEREQQHREPHRRAPSGCGCATNERRAPARFAFAGCTHQPVALCVPPNLTRPAQHVTCPAWRPRLASTAPAPGKDRPGIAFDRRPRSRSISPRGVHVLNTSQELL